MAGSWGGDCWIMGRMSGVGVVIVIGAGIGVVDGRSVEVDECFVVVDVCFIFVDSGDFLCCLFDEGWDVVCNVVCDGCFVVICGDLIVFGCCRLRGGVTWDNSVGSCKVG